MGEKNPIFRCPSARAGADFFEATVRCADNNNNNSCFPHIMRVHLQPSSCGFFYYSNCLLLLLFVQQAHWPSHMSNCAQNKSNQDEDRAPEPDSDVAGLGFLGFGRARTFVYWASGVPGFCVSGFGPVSGFLKV